MKYQNSEVLSNNCRRRTVSLGEDSHISAKELQAFCSVENFRSMFRSGIMSLILISVLGSLDSFAADDWKFFPQKTVAQKELLKQVQSGFYKQALMAWKSSLSGSSFKSTYTGRALFSWVLFESGAKTNAMEKLFVLKAPHHIEPQVKDLWRGSLTKNKDSLALAGGILTRQWRSFLGNDLYESLRTKPVFNISKKSTLTKLSKLAKATSTPKDEKPWYQWQLALTAAHLGRNELANNQISRLLEQEQAVIDDDALFLTRGRIAYQQKEFSEAIDWYRKVSKNSDQWFTAKEELAWAYLRDNKPNKTISELHTVLSPVFASISGPETDFLSAFANLMICDYNKIFKITKGFKNRHGQKIKALEAIVKNDNSQTFLQFLKVVDTKPIRLSSFAKILKDLPRGFQRDSFLKDHMQYRRAMIQETLVLRSMNGPVFNKLADISLSRAQTAKNKTYDRLKALAQNELAEYKVMIQKLHIIEAEVIQRLHMDQNTLGQRKKLKNPVPNSSDIISFPVTQEVWLDEVDNYHAEVRDCPKITRASL